jgi:hypothetical protein
MLIEDELKTVDVNYKIREIVPFLIKLTPKRKKETSVILKKFLNKDRGITTFLCFPLWLAAVPRINMRKACAGTTKQYQKTLLMII